jgi:hypothetical protein
LSPTAYRPSPTGTDTVIRNDYLVNDDRVGGGRQGMANVAFDAAGNAVVTWEDYVNGDGDALARRFNAAGLPLGGSFRVCDDADMWWQGEPAVGVDPDGSFLVAFEDRKHGGSDVMAQRYEPSGAPIDTNFQINDNTGYSDQRGAAITVLPDGRYVVVWEDWRNDIGDIYAQILAGDGSPRGPNFRVNEPPDWQQYWSAVGSDAHGNFVIAWGSGIQGWDIWAQRYDSAGVPQGANFKTNDDPNQYRNQWSPSVGVAPGGSFLVAWDDWRGDTLNSQIFAQRYDAAGQAQGANFRVNDSIPNRAAYSSSIACDAAGNYFVVWADNRTGQAGIYGQGFDAAGNRLGANFRIDAGPANQGDPVVRFSPQNEYWVVWSDGRQGNPDIYAQRLSPARTPIGTNFRVNDDSFSSQQRVPTIAANSRGLNITIWEDERNGDCDVYCQLADSLGNPLGPNRRANDDHVGANHFYSTAAIDDAGNSLTAWTDGRNGYNIYAQAFDAGGNPVGGNFRVNDNPAEAFHWCPAAARDSAGDAVIVFMDNRQGGYDIYGQRYDAAGQPKDTNFRINDDAPGSWHQYPQVAMSRYGRFVAAWMEERDNGSVYCQVYDSAGNAVGPNLKANDNTGSAYMGYPGVGCDAAGNFVVAWEDGRNPNETDIYAQRFDLNGTRLGGNFRVNSDPPGSDQYSPSVALDPQGRIIVLWNDWRSPRHNPQIYVQRYFADGSPCGGEAIINEPDLFYYNHHWSMNHSVAVGGARWFFTWTDNRRHQGFDTYNKITDWNLVSITDPRHPPLPTPDHLSLRVWPSVLTSDGLVHLQVTPGAPVTVDILDISGRKVGSPYRQSPAAYRLPHLSSGAYFVVARSGQQKAITKICVMESI